MKIIDIATRTNLILAKVEILKLKANDYAWQCETPQKVKEELNKTLTEINGILEDKDE
jgi:hypothetical protein